ncbi:hypothetical protein [Paraburkholderia tuberum]|uniref:Uncharacterized protein n=1 Tax=Paraburkholderia tuberum TaxID=157910 RepID=A0A1H1JSJ9_9BURK|nr:hypothetical protein [Paraburkholderia tuberum]SDR52890.1 hypothetical protein SAMN05445850_5566 [Paraburkholderia tuberum]
MKLTAKCRIKICGEYVLPGETLEVDESVATGLIARGRAEKATAVSMRPKKTDEPGKITVKATETKTARAAGDPGKAS